MANWINSKETISVKPVSIRVLTIDNKKNFSLNLFKQLPLISLASIYNKAGDFAENIEPWGKSKVAKDNYAVFSKSGILCKFDVDNIKTAIGNVNSRIENFKHTKKEKEDILNTFFFKKDITYNELFQFIGSKYANDYYYSEQVNILLNNINISSYSQIIPSEIILKATDQLVNELEEAKANIIENELALANYQTFLNKVGSLPQLFIGS